VPTAAFRHLALAHGRELVRDPLTLWMGMLFPFLFIGLFLAMPDVTGPGGQRIDALAFGLPGVLIMALLTLALFGTATPITILRDQGVLRALALTPVRRLVIAMSVVPSRLVVAVAQIALVLAVTALTGALALTDLPLLVLTLTLCAASMFSIGMFIGGVVRSVMGGSAVSALVLPIVLMLSGVLLPLSILPGVAQRAAEILPFTYMGDLLRHCLVGTALAYPVWRGLAYLAATTVVMVVLTSRTFRFDEGER
jgi:ABC-2 type transport system permease protein